MKYHIMHFYFCLALISGCVQSVWMYKNASSWGTVPQTPCWGFAPRADWETSVPHADSWHLRILSPGSALASETGHNVTSV